MTITQHFQAGGSTSQPTAPASGAQVAIDAGVGTQTAEGPTSARWQRPTLLSLLLLGFTWRLVGLTRQSFWRDEVDVVYLSLRPLSETISMFVSPAQNGPLYYLLIRPWIAVAGSSEYALRYTSVLLGTLAVALAWAVARRLLPGAQRADLRNAALLATIFLAFNPYQIWYSQEGKMYALVMVLTLLSTWSWLMSMQHGGAGRWVRYLVVTSVSIYSHLMTALILPLHFAWFLLAWPLNRRRWRGYTATAAGFVLPYIPLIWWQWHYLTTLDYNTGYPFTPFVEVVRVLLLGHARGVLADVDAWWLVPIFFAATAGLLVGSWEMRGSASRDGSPRSESTDTEPQRDDWAVAGSSDDGQAATLMGRRSGQLFETAPLLPVASWARMGMIVTWLVLPVLLIHGVSLIKPIFVDRYVIWIAPAFAVLLALGVQVVWNSGGRWTRLLAVGLVGYILIFWTWTGWQQSQRPNKTQLRQAISHVAERRQPNDLLILQIPHTHFAYRYYTSEFGADPFAGSEARLQPWMGGLWTHNGLPDDQATANVDATMRRQTAEFAEAWVILVEERSWDPRRLMTGWLEEHATLLERQQFHGIEARKYRLPNERPRSGTSSEP